MQHDFLSPQRTFQTIKANKLAHFAFLTQQPEVELNQNPINYGAWDSCASAKVVPINTVMRAKREFLTPAWEREALAKLKEEGRDIASIDKDLKVFAHQMN